LLHAPSAWFAALTAIVIGYSGPLLLVFQTADNAGLSRAELTSWLWAIIVGSGVATIVLALWYRKPILVAWSTPGIALLTTTLGQYRWEEAVGAFLAAGLVMTALGVSGLFGRAMALVPQPVVLGMLAGVLLRFGIGLFTALPGEPVLIVLMIAAFVFARRSEFRAPTVAALVAGLLVAGLQGQIQIASVAPEIATPMWTWPAFSLPALLGIGLPLVVVTLASQNAAGIAVLRAQGYPDAPEDGPIAVTGAIWCLLAPFGGHGINLAALTAAVVSGPEAHPDPHQRYGTAVLTGVLKCLIGLFGATVANIMSGLPTTLIAGVSGLALLSTIATSLAGAMQEPAARESALITFLFAAAGVPLLGIASPFWGLLTGAALYTLLNKR
jgi:benzoate membrane transport protein